MKARRLSQVKMTARDFDQQITLQAQTATPDGAGGSVVGWANFATDATVWAAVRALAGNEQFSEDRTTATAKVLFTIRNRDDVTEKDRIVFEGLAYNIRTVMKDGPRKMYLKIEAERGVA